MRTAFLLAQTNIPIKLLSHLDGPINHPGPAPFQRDRSINGWANISSSSSLSSICNGRGREMGMDDGGEGGGDRGIGEFPLVLRQIKSLNLCSHPELIAEFPGRYAPLSLHHHHSCNILCHLSGNSFAIKFNAFFLTRISRFILRFFFAQHFLLHHRFLLKLTLSLVRGGGGW